MTQKRLRGMKWLGVAMVSLMLVLGASGTGIADGDGKDSKKKVYLKWKDGYTDFYVKSSKGIAKIVMKYCDGTYYKVKDLEYGDKSYKYNGDKPIAKVWVKSGGYKGANGYWQKFVNGKCPDNDRCKGPQNVQVESVAGPKNVVTWDAVAGASSYNVYRQEGGMGAFVLQDSVAAPTTTFEDTMVVGGTMYTYRVTAIVYKKETEFCEEVPITTIPVLPNLLAAGMATLGGVGIYAMSRRRR